MNLTLSLDEQLVEQARIVAAARGISLNRMIREELERMTAAVSGDDLVQELEEQWAPRMGRLGWMALESRGAS